jgi:hypothetical protein
MYALYRVSSTYMYQMDDPLEIETNSTMSDFDVAIHSIKGEFAPMMIDASGGQKYSLRVNYCRNIIYQI